MLVTACCSLRVSKLRRSCAYSSADILAVFALPCGRDEEIKLVSIEGSGAALSAGGAEIDRFAFRGYDTNTPETIRSGDTGRGDRDEADGVLCALGALGGSGLTSLLFPADWAMFRLNSATLFASVTT